MSRPCHKTGYPACTAACILLIGENGQKHPSNRWWKWFILSVFRYFGASVSRQLYYPCLASFRVRSWRKFSFYCSCSIVCSLIRVCNSACRPCVMHNFSTTTTSAWHTVSTSRPRPNARYSFCFVHTYIVSILCLSNEPQSTSSEIPQHSHVYYHWQCDSITTGADISALHGWLIDWVRLNVPPNTL